jgi:hypothetical protein
MVVSEFPLVQPHLYDAQIPPVVYLSGVLMFVAGLAIVRAHNHWAKDWTVLITLTGWFFLGLLSDFRKDRGADRETPVSAENSGFPNGPGNADPAWRAARFLGNPRATLVQSR